MADLHNLLEEVREDYEDEEIREEEEQETILASSSAQADGSQDWEDGDREELEVPAALAELQQKQLNLDLDQGSDAEGEEQILAADEQEIPKEDESHYYSRLKKLWQQEVACPELLPLDESMVTEVIEEIQRREDTIAQLSEQSGDMEALLGSVLKVDSDRAKFMLSDLLRTRLSKIQEHPLHMRDLVDRMSEQEVSLFVYLPVSFDVF